MDEDDILIDDTDCRNLGCLDCGSVFPINEIYGGGCPICESSNITTFEDVLNYTIEHRAFLEQMGLAEED